MKFTICDDVRQDMDDLARQCMQYAKQNALEIELTKVLHPKDLNFEDTDILFLDIEMPEKNGIEIQRERELISGKPLIIFFTNYPAHSMHSHGTNVIGFLPKPVDEELLSAYIDKGIALLETNKIVHFGREQRYNSRQIQYIEMESGCSKAVLNDGKRSVGVYKTMKEWEEELLPYWFVRISQSCLVNCQYIQRIHSGKVVLKNGMRLHISRRVYRACNQRYLTYLEKTARFM